MKNYFTHILIALLFSASAIAQNPLFRTYGDSYAQVKAHLSSLDYVTVSEGEDFIAAETDGFRMFYFFNHKALYKMVLSSSFDRRREAEDMVTHFRNYYQRSRSLVEVNELRNERVVTSFTALRSDEQVLVRSTEVEADNFEILVVAESESWSPDFANTISMK
jgi:hypothetical protein